MNKKRSLTYLLKVRRIDKVPPGWLNGEQLAAAEGYTSIDSFRPILNAALKARLLDRKDFFTDWGDTIRRRPFYRRAK